MASEGYVTRRTWCSHGRFSSLRILSRLPLLSVHRDIHLSTSLVRRCVTTEMIRTCQNDETDAFQRLARHSDQWITHGSISSRFRNLEIRARVYQIFLAKCIGNVTCLTLCIQWLTGKCFENCKLWIWERKRNCKLYELNINIIESYRLKVKDWEN